MLQSLPSGINTFVSNFRRFFVFQDRQVDYEQAYLAYHRTLDFDYGTEASFECSLYIHSSAEVLRKQVRRMAFQQITTGDVHVGQLVADFSVKRRSRPRKTHGEVRAAVRPLHCVSSYFLRLVDDFPVI